MRLFVCVFAAGFFAAACGGDGGSAEPVNQPAALGSFEQVYGILAGTSGDMPVRVTSSTGTAGFATFVYDAAADRGELSFVVCVAKPCPDAGAQGAVSFRSPPLSVVERIEDRATFRTAPGATTDVAVLGARLRHGVPTELVIDVLDPPEAHLEGAFYPFEPVQ